MDGWGPLATSVGPPRDNGAISNMTVEPPARVRILTLIPSPAESWQRRHSRSIHIDMSDTRDSCSMSYCRVVAGTSVGRGVAFDATLRSSPVGIQHSVVESAMES